MTCKDRILSDDYADLIVDYDLLPQLLETVDVDACYHAVDAGYGIVYVRRDGMPPMSIGYYGYSAIPKLYGLMQTGVRPFDPSCLVAMGNIRVQNPPLALQGNGVIIGFIDTGECVIILQSQCPGILWQSSGKSNIMFLPAQYSFSEMQVPIFL